MLKTTSFAIMLSSIGVAAFAAGPEPVPMTPVVMAPLPVVDSFWEGAYLGVQLGYSYSEFDTGARPDDFSDDQVIGGFTAGYLWSVGNGFYVGPEFQYDFADLTVTDATTGDTASFEEIARLKLIVGSEVGNGLLYGSAGVAYGSFDDIGTVFDGFDGGDTSYVLGVGYDYRVGDNWTVGGEYMYHNFSGIGAAGNDVNLNTLHLKATYRF